MNALKLLIALSLAMLSASGNPGAAADSIPGWIILNIDIDRSIPRQKQTSALINERKDLHASTNAIRLWSGARGLKILRSAVGELRKKFPADKWLTFEGSGDFHQVAAVLIETLPDSARPVTLVVLDNHPDWFKAPEHFHCGAWVARTMHYPFVEKVILLGQDSSDIRGDQFRFVPFKELANGRLELHPLERQSAIVPGVWFSKVKGVASAHKCVRGTELKFETVRQQTAEVMADKLARELSGKNVYISVDKDVLAGTEALTDWDQGRMTLSEMLVIINKIAGSANLVGMDVCGERAPEPIHGLLKKTDSGRLLKGSVRDFEQANRLNEKVNLSIIKLIEQQAAAAGGNGKTGKR
jgi:hypothetical protein